MYPNTPVYAADASVDDRATFLAKTYLHLFGAVVAFVALEAAWFVSDLARPIVELTIGNGNMGMLLVLGAFMAVSFLAERWARSDAPAPMQYLGLGLYVLAESVIFVPLIAFAIVVAGDLSLLGKAGGITLTMFAALSGIVFVTRKDFSFLRGVLMVCGIGALGLVVASLLFGFTLGLAFAWFMVAVASGYILYHTSNVMLHYRTDQHVAAALALFASLATLFWYVLRIMTSRRN